jgi:hypothetical protein
MKYFALLSNNKIVSAENICQGRFYDGIHFSLGNTRFKYVAYTGIDDCKGYRLCKNYFFKQVFDEWFVTEDIKSLIFLNEVEDEDLNYFQSTDFNAGVIYNKIEKNMALMIKNTSSAGSCFVGELCLPAIQLIPAKGCIGCTEHDIMETTIHTVIEHFNAVYGKNFILNISSWKRDKQYFKFDFSVKRKEIYKEMTIEEIEAELGYKIKVVSGVAAHGKN